MPEENRTMKKFFIFQEVTFRAQNMKKPTLKKLLTFQEMGLFKPKLKKKFLYFSYFL